MTHEQAVSTFASERYLLDEMTEPERATFEEHYFSCAACAEDLRSGALMRDGARAGLVAAGLSGDGLSRVGPSVGPTFRSGDHPERESHAGRVVPLRPRRPWYQSAVIPWAAAATLAIVAGYQTLVVLPELRPLNEPQALAPVTLRPASRGEVPEIPIGSETAAITLAVDTSSATGTGELSYDLRSASGTLVASGKAQAPPFGALLLLIPAKAVSTPGRYVLSIADGDYEFEVVAQ
jgi:hypothetical protein